MGNRPQILPILILFLFIFACDHANGARHTQFLKVKPQTHKSPASDFFGFLPKGVPIPPSGPSNRHNGIGVEGREGLP
ncbi:UNVERIFIED_CONTAM: Protein IDA-LIKE 2 [Sesamum indicum]